MEFERLFSPLHIRGCVFPNRIMSTAAVTRLAAEDGHITEAITSRYRRMAKGGLGAMVVEAAVVLPSRSSFNLRISDDLFVDELKSFIDNIRSANPEREDRAPAHPLPQTQSQRLAAESRGSQNRGDPGHTRAVCEGRLKGETGRI